MSWWRIGQISVRPTSSTAMQWNLLKYIKTSFYKTITYHIIYNFSHSYFYKFCFKVVGQDLRYQDRIMIIECGGVCGLSSPSDQVTQPRTAFFNNILSHPFLPLFGIRWLPASASGGFLENARFVRKCKSSSINLARNLL